MAQPGVAVGVCRGSAIRSVERRRSEAAQRSEAARPRGDEATRQGGAARRGGSEAAPRGEAAPPGHTTWQCGVARQHGGGSGGLTAARAARAVRRCGWREQCRRRGQRDGG